MKNNLSPQRCPLIEAGCLILGLAFNVQAQLPTNNAAAPSRLAVMVNTNGLLTAPTNFFAANSNALNAAVAGSGGGSQSPLTGNINAAGFSGTNYGTLQASNINAANFSGGIFSGNATNLTNIPAAQITGTISDARLSTNVVFKHYWTNILAFSENFSGTLGNWESQGTASFTISSGHLHVVSGTGALDNFLVYTNYVTAMHAWTAEFDLTPQSTNSGDGLGWGIRSRNVTLEAAGADVNLFFLYGADNGSISAWYGASNAMTMIGGSASSAEFAPASAGQKLHVKGGRRDNVWVWSVSNTVSGVSALFALTTESSANISTNGFEPNTGSFCFWSDQGAQDVASLTFKIGTLYPIDFIGVGDSITSGYGATTFANCYAEKLKMLMPNSVITVVSAGNDKTAELLLRTNELNLLPSSNLWVMVGGNDVATGVGTATWQANLTNFINSVSPGRQMFICMPTPWDTANLTPLATFVRTNYTSTTNRVVDLFNPLKNTLNGTALKTVYSFDGIHPNDTGHDITARALYQALNNRN